MKNIKIYLSYLLPYKRLLSFSLFFTFLYAFFSAVSMLSLMPVLDVLFKEGSKVYEKPTFTGVSDIKKENIQQLVNYYITEYTESGESTIIVLFWLMLIMIAMFFLKNFFSYLSLVYTSYLNNAVLKELRDTTYKKVVSLNIAFFTKYKKGDLISRMSGDIGIIRAASVTIIRMLFREPLTLLFTLATMVWISWKLTIFVFVFLPISGIIISRIGKVIKKYSGKIFQLEGELLSRIEETLGGIKIIKNFTSEDFFNKRFLGQTEEIQRLHNKIGRKTSLSGPTSEFLGIFAISMIFIYGGYLVLEDGSITGGAFITYMGMAYQILTPAKAIAKASNSLQAAAAAVERVNEVLKAENPLKDKPNAKVITGFQSEIKFHNISFKYGNEYVLKDFNLTVPKGKTVALVGESGSGKSTLANLVTRFYDVDKGSITFDGIDIKNVTTKSLREHMGIVAQDSILFNDSIKNNISLGVDNATEEAIIQAAKVANAHNYISEFTEGYDTNVGDGGGELSGGQRQRVAIARAVLKNPPIMILDEATSALDTESEKIVQDALENMMKNRTSIVIAHRLSTVQNADLIVVMKKGKIVEQGTHQELLEKSGVYSKLVSLQSLEAQSLG